jgi:hypothetical protein
MVLSLQRTAGNAAVAGLVAQRKGPAGPPPPLAVAFGPWNGSAPDRLPLERKTKLKLTIGGLPKGKAVAVDIEGSGGDKGTATVTDGKSLKSTGSVVVRGDAQTSPGKAGSLKVRAMVDGATVATSSGFSVASFPKNWTNKRSADIDEPTRLGVEVTDGWSSDGTGKISDLDEVEISELVDLASRDNPPFTSAGGTSTTSGTSGYNPANALTSDTHSYGRATMATAGLNKKKTYRIVYTQLCIFKCNRTGVVDDPVPRSGYTITHTIWWSGKAWRHKTVKAPAATTVGGFTSAAGAGTATSKTHKL